MLQNAIILVAVYMRIFSLDLLKYIHKNLFA